MLAAFRNSGLTVVTGLVAILSAPPVGAQGILDRVVGRIDEDHPLVIPEVSSATVSVLGWVVGVPMGFEQAAGGSIRVPPIYATGRTLREVADAMVAADARYGWHEDNGVLLFRAAATWPDGATVLDAPVGAVTLDDIESADAFDAITALFGVSRQARTGPNVIRPGGGPGDTRRFSVELPSGGTLREALNGIVRAHGTLAWSVERQASQLSVSLTFGPGGSSAGTTRNSVVRTRALVMQGLHPASRPPLERVVGAFASGAPLKMSAIQEDSIFQLARAVLVPMGIQLAPPGNGHGAPSIVKPFSVSGMRLKDVLNRLTHLDPRYEWREVDGVIVFRPVAAWSDSTDPLYRLVPGVQLQAPLSKIVGVAVSALGGPARSVECLLDGRSFSVDVPAATVLDLLSAIARAHGELAWTWKETSDAERRLNGGRPYALTWSIFRAGGCTVGVP